MKIASVADVKTHLSEYLRASAERPVVVTRNGKAVAVLVAVSDDEELERLLMAHSPRLQAILGAARQRIQEGKGIPHETFWQQMENEDLTEKRSDKRNDGNKKESKGRTGDRVRSRGKS